MGLIDKAPPMVQKGLSIFLLLSIFGICVAMTVCPPKEPLLGPNGGNDATAAINTGDTAWLLASSALVLLQTPGLAFFYGGMMDAKNIVSVMLQSVITLGIIPILWTFLGFSLAFAPDLGYPGFIGDPKHYGLMYNVGAMPDPLAPTVPCTIFLMFQCVFAVITPSLIVGAIANRVNFPALCMFITLWHFTVYCPLAHMVWTPQGLVHSYGVIDFAGGTVVHMSSGWAALAAALYLGPKKKTTAELSIAAQHQLDGTQAPPNPHSSSHGGKKPANVTYVLLGAALLWFGWFGFNGGSALGAGALAGQAFFNTNTAAATSMITWLLLDHSFRNQPIGPIGLSVGAVIGLVVITPGAGFVTVGGAALMGIIGCTMCFIAQIAMDHFGSRYVDDTLDVFVCHGVGGTSGMLLTALFTTTDVNTSGADGGFYGNGLQFGRTIWVCIVLIAWFITFTLGCLWVTNLFISLRVTEEEELAGLDVSKHGASMHTFPEPIKPGSVHGHGVNGVVPMVAESA